MPLYNLMEDAATAEISRSQVWQWLRHGARLEDGRAVDKALVLALIEDEVGRLNGDLPRLDVAVALFVELILADRCTDFLTLPAYGRLPG